jgi:hypothetical protein
MDREHERARKTLGGRPLVRRGFVRTLLLVGVLLPAVLPAQQRDDPLQQGRAALQNGDVRRAIRLADRLLQANPLHHEALTLKIEALAAARDWESALAPYERFIAAGGPEDPALLQTIGRALLWESIAFYPPLRTMVLGRLACAGDRQALASIQRPSDAARPEDTEALLVRARLGNFDAVLQLRELANAGAPPIRVTALQALELLRDHGAGRVIAAALEDPDLSIRLAGLRAARALRPQGVAPQLQALAADPQPLLQVGARAALATLGDRAQADPLRPWLESQVPDLRLGAIAGLLALEGPSPALIDGLAALATPRNAGIWPQAIDLLLVHAPDRAAAAVRQALRGPDANSRILGLRSYPRVPAEDGDPALLRALLLDPNTLVRIETGAVLAGRPRLCEP